MSPLEWVQVRRTLIRPGTATGAALRGRALGVTTSIDLECRVGHRGQRCSQALTVGIGATRFVSNDGDGSRQVRRVQPPYVNVYGHRVAV